MSCCPQFGFQWNIRAQHSCKRDYFWICLSHILLLYSFRSQTLEYTLTLPPNLVQQPRLLSPPFCSLVSKPPTAASSSSAKGLPLHKSRLHRHEAPHKNTITEQVQFPLSQQPLGQ